MSSTIYWLKTIYPHFGSQKFLDELKDIDNWFGLEGDLSIFYIWLFKC